LQTGRQLYESGLDHYRDADHGDYHEGEGLSEAIKDFEKSIQKGYKDRDVFDKLALSYNFLNQDLVNEERVYSLGLLAHPKDIKFYYRRGDCRKELKKHKAAFEDYNEVVVLDTAKESEYLSSALYERGAMRYILGDTTNANRDREIAQSITDHELRIYSDYCQLWK
jgi:tetratricopeptide (TPR) repeat protein